MRRAFTSDLEVSDDGRTVTGRMFPFNKVAHIRELDDAGQLDEYDEAFLPGCTVRMQQIAHRRGGQPAWIKFTVDHLDNFDARLGYCTVLEEKRDGAWGTFRLYDTPQLTKIRSMLDESHKGLSIEFIDAAPPLIEGSLRQRRQINMSAVTATPIPVYAEAGIVSVRGVDAPDFNATPNLSELDRILAELRA